MQQNTAAHKPLKIALVGAGVVGAGVLRLLSKHAELLAARAGRRIVVCAIATRDIARARKRLPAEYAPLLVKGWRKAATHPDADIVVELIGGDSSARECVQLALQNGRAVVTANKALLASHGDEIFAAAAAVKKPVAFEAAVAGCIPAVKTLREALAADDVYEVAGIINGTCNYIVSAMSDEKQTFAAALADAQSRGYAEADPTLDIDGIDSAHKIALIARLAFNARPRLSQFYTAGVRHFNPRDIYYAGLFGFCVKLLAQARRESCGGIAITVQPTLLPCAHPMAAVGGAMNAIFVRSAFAGESIYYGAGAGGDPTAAAVVADIIDIARGNGALQTQDGGEIAQLIPPSDFRAPYFLRLRVLDRPGVLAEIAGVLAAQQISIEAIHQNESAPGKRVDIVMLLHENTRGRIDAAVATIKTMKAVFGDAQVMPIQRFNIPPARK